MAPHDQFVRHATLKRVIDGDTLLVDLDLGWTLRTTEYIRLIGVDTPEPRGAEAPAGKFVTRQLQAFIGDETSLIIHSHNFRLGKFGRTLATVWVNDVSLNEWLLMKDLGWPTDVDGNIIGSRSLKLLRVPDAVLAKCLENMA